MEKVIISIEADTSKAVKGVKDLNKSVTETNKTATKTGKGLTGAFKGFGSAVSGAIPMLGKLKAALISTGVGAIVVALGSLVALFKSAADVGADFQKSLSALSAITGKTSDELSVLNQQARELGATTQFTAIEVVGLQTELAKLGFTVKDIENSTPAILDLASSLEVDLSSAAELAGSVVRSFGLTTKDTQKVVDVMSLSTSSSALNFEALRESLKLVAPASRATGVSIEKTAALLGVLANNGLKGSVAGNGLSKTFIELNKQGITLEEGMEKVKNSTNKLNTAIDLVGVVGAKSFLSLAESGEQINQLEKDFEGAEGSAKRMAEVRLDNLAGDTTKLSSAWEGFLLGIENGTGQISKLARRFVQMTTSIISFFTTQESVTQGLQQQRTEIYKIEAQLNSYDAILKDSTKSTDELKKAEEDRLRIIKEAQKKFPKTLGNLTAETVRSIDLKKALQDVNKELVNKIIIQQQQEKLDEQAEKTASALNDLMDKESNLLNRTSAVRKKYIDEGVKIEGTSNAAVVKAIRDSANQSGLSSEMIKLRLNQANLLENSQKQLTSATETFNQENEKGIIQAAKYDETLKKLGITQEEVSSGITDTDTTTGTTTSTTISDEEKEKLKKEREELAKIDAKTKKQAQDFEDKTELEKAERKRERALAELNAVELEETEKREAKKRINDYYDDIEKNAKLKDEEKAKQKAESDSKVAAEKLVLDKEQGLLSFDEQRALISEREGLLKEDTIINDKDKLRLTKQFSDAKIKINELEAKAQKKRVADTSKALDTLSDVVGKNTVAGKGMSIASATINTYQGVTDALAAKTITPFETALKFVNAAGILSNGLKTVKQITAVKIPNTSGGGGTGGASAPSGGGLSMPSLPPAFNVVGASETSQLADSIGSQSQEPTRAYVVSADVTTSQEMDRNTIEGASI